MSRDFIGKDIEFDNYLGGVRCDRLESFFKVGFFG
jgi:hypothetical protein